MCNKFAVFLLQYLYELANLGMKTCENQVDVNCLRDSHFWQRNIFLDNRKRTNFDIPKDISLRTGMDHNFIYQHHEQPQEH